MNAAKTLREQAEREWALAGKIRHRYHKHFDPQVALEDGWAVRVTQAVFEEALTDSDTERAAAFAETFKRLFQFALGPESISKGNQVAVARRFIAMAWVARPETVWWREPFRGVSNDWMCAFDSCQHSGTVFP
jgi:hypothetical protein